MSFMLLGILNSQAAGAGGGGFVHIGTVDANNATQAVFTGLSGYTNYYVICAPSDKSYDYSSSQSYNNLQIQFNGDTAYNYQRAHYAYRSGSGRSVYANNNESEYNLAGVLSGDSGSGNIGSPNQIWIQNSTDRWKMIMANTFQPRCSNDSGGLWTKGIWENNSEITSILFKSGSGQQFRKTKFYLYGTAV